MVAVALSMVLVAGVVQVYSSSKASYSVQNQLSTLQNNQRIAVELLSNEIRKAGLSINQAVANFISGTDGGGADPDEITIRYESDRNCLGNPTDNGIAVNRYFVNVNNGSLMCQGNGGQTLPLISGVVNMQVLYGEDTDPIDPSNPAPRSANRYVQPAIANMTNVVSVRIALLFATDDVVRGVDETAARSYILLDAPAINIEDQLRREVITSTITLRNII